VSLLSERSCILWMKDEGQQSAICSFEIWDIAGVTPLASRRSTKASESMRAIMRRRTTATRCCPLRCRQYHQVVYSSSLDVSISSSLSASAYKGESGKIQGGSLFHRQSQRRLLDPCAVCEHNGSCLEISCTSQVPYIAVWRGILSDAALLDLF
jgi:hypothetical protein